MGNQPNTILICEDHQIVIDGLVSIINNDKSYKVVGAINDGGLVVQEIKRFQPDIILLDLNLPNKNGLELIGEIKALKPCPKIIVLTMYNNESIVKKVKQNNANRFLLKNCSSNDLLTAFDSVLNNNIFYMGKGVKNDVVENDGFLESIKLTRREREIILELSKGYNVPKIAKLLFISPRTVETHKKNIFKKLNIHNSIDLIKLINEKKLL